MVLLGLPSQLLGDPVRPLGDSGDGAGVDLLPSVEQPAGKLLEER